MRIVHITPFYHPVIGGVEYVAKSVAERLEASRIALQSPYNYNLVV